MITIIPSYIIAIMAGLAAIALMTVRDMPFGSRVSIASPMVGLLFLYIYIGSSIGDPIFISILRGLLIFLFLMIFLNVVIYHAIKRGG